VKSKKLKKGRKQKNRRRLGKKEKGIQYKKLS
jgi:hypothetical protein